ncbi:MAG TPA: AsmA family protein [Candidatus Eisenbacteria bacterium]|nr:AsmA family protein [Candidatus Eisenbacteria bacterium]
MDKKKIFRYALIAVGVVIVILLALPFFINANTFRPMIEGQLTAALGRKVQVGDLSLSIFSGSLTASNLAIADDPRFGNTPFLSAKSFRVGVEMWPLITSKALNVTGLTIENPELSLVRNQQGQWNFASLGGNSGAPPNQAKSAPQGVSELQVAKLQLKDGRATISSGGSKPSVYEKVDLEASNVSFKSQFPVEVSAELPGGGTFKLEGKVGPVNAADSSLTPLDAKVAIKSLDLAKTGFVDPSTGISGLVDVTNSLSSKGGVATAQGNATFAKLQLAKGGAPAGVPVVVDFAIDYNLANSTGTLTQGAIKIGKATVQLSGTFEQRSGTTMLNMKANGQGLPVTDLEAALPAFGVVLPKGSSLQSGTASANLTILGPADKAVTAGNVGLFNAQLAGYDLGSAMSAVTKLTGGGGSKDTSIQKFTANVRVAPEGIQANSIDAVVPAIGEVTGSGTVSNSGALNFNMVATLSSSGAMGNIPGLQHTSGGGATKVPFAIQGTTSDPKFVPNVGAMAASAITGAVKSQATTGLGGLFGKKKPK